MIAFSFAALFALSVASSLHAQDRNGCSNRGVAGKWSYRLAGSILLDANNSDTYPNDAPIAGVGTITLDRSGNATGGGPYKSGNTLSHVTFSGTYTVNSDCIGSLSLDTVIDGQDLGNIEFDQVFGDNMNEFHWVARSQELVVNVDGKRLFRDTGN
jgi:hypothetical protein